MKEQTLSVLTLGNAGIHVNEQRSLQLPQTASRSGVGTSASCLGVSSCEIRPESAYRHFDFSWLLSASPGKRHNLYTDSEAHPASYSVGTEVLSPVIKPAPSAEVNNMWSCIVFPLYSLMVRTGTTLHFLYSSCNSSSVFP